MSFQSHRRVLRALVSKICWNIVAGHNTGASFQLWVGGKTRRPVPLDHPSKSRILRTAARRLPYVMRNFKPEWTLLVWCSWRLSQNGKVKVTSDDCENGARGWRSFRRLKGCKVLGVKVSELGDLELRLSKGRLLTVFRDTGVLDPSIDTNWELFYKGQPSVRLKNR